MQNCSIHASNTKFQIRDTNNKIHARTYLLYTFANIPSVQYCILDSLKIIINSIILPTTKNYHIKLNLSKTNWNFLSNTFPNLIKLLILSKWYKAMWKPSNPYLKKWNKTAHTHNEGKLNGNTSQPYNWKNGMFCGISMVSPRKRRIFSDPWKETEHPLYWSIFQQIFENMRSNQSTQFYRFSRILGIPRNCE